MRDPQYIFRSGILVIMADRPKVAVITRTKDRPLLLERAIQSVHSQEYSNFVHVIINDSGDSKVVDGIVNKHREMIDGRVKVIHNTTSRGMEAASNKAIKSVDSEYIAIHDDDDTWHSEFLNQSVNRLDATQAAGLVVLADKIIERIDGSRVKKVKQTRWMPDMRVVNIYRQCIDNQMTPITFIYRRDVYDELGGYDESLPVLGDWDFGIRFLQKYDVDFYDPGYALAYYHHRKSTGSSTDNSFGDGKEKHRYWSNVLLNRYLRQELKDGRLGVGYIMSKLKYDRREKARLVESILPRLVTEKLKSRF